MPVRVILFLAFFLAPFSVFASHNPVIISEIFFDPAGTDTGKEYVVLKNTGQTAVDMTGFDLYLDIAKYYTFSGFALDSGANVKINLRASGTDTGSGLFRQEGSSNMGNTSGSIAVFSGTDHGKDTILDFVQYGKPGKTWESAASKAGLWQRGESIDLSGFEPGCVIERISNGHGPNSWSAVCNTNEAPPLNDENSDSGGQPPQEEIIPGETSQQEETGNNSSGQDSQDNQQNEQPVILPQKPARGEVADISRQEPQNIQDSTEIPLTSLKQAGVSSKSSSKKSSGIQENQVLPVADKPVYTNQTVKPQKRADPETIAEKGRDVAFEKLPAHAASPVSGIEKGGKSNYIFLLTSIIAGVALGFLAVALGRKF